MSETAISTCALLGRPEFDLHGPAPGHDVERVQGQVQQQLLELVPVPLHHDRGGRRDEPQVDPLLLGPATDQGERPLDDDGQAQRRRSGRAGRAKSRNVWRVRSIRRISCSMTRRSSAGRPRASASFEVDLDQALDRGERVAQLVGHAGGHLADRRHLLGP